jgi:proteasome-associated ATPase
MDGLQESGAFVLLATNRPSSIDSAIVRDGRIDRRIRVTRPTKYDARAILQLHLKKTPLECTEDQAIDAITESLYDPKLVLYRVKKSDSVGKGVAMTLGNLVSGAMLAGVIDRVTSLAMRRGMTTVASSKDEEIDRVKVQDFQEAVQAVLREARDVNHDDELAEFTDGWADQVTAITRENGAATVAVARDAS